MAMKLTEKIDFSEFGCNEKLVKRLVKAMGYDITAPEPRVKLGDTVYADGPHTVGDEKYMRIVISYDTYKKLGGRDDHFSERKIYVFDPRDQKAKWSSFYWNKDGEKVRRYE